MKKKLFLLLGILTLSMNNFGAKLEEVKKGFAKNVIVLIPDGMSTEGVTLTRWVYNDGEPLNMDEMASGMVRTHNANTVIADSAPAGTAMATGHKAQVPTIGVKPKEATLYGAIKDDEKDGFAPIANVLEVAKLKGKATGIIATSEIMHATPAAFSAHATTRKNYNDLAEQQVHQDIDVVFGGGYSYLTAKSRDDKEDMIDTLKNKGVKVITTKKELNGLTRNDNKIWGLFAEKDLPYNIDRKSDEPSLAELTEKAIEILSTDKDGFFLMVEGSKVDWAAHPNNTAALIGDIKSFDEAVGVALKYAKSNKDTLVVVATDHGNGGITIGNRNTTSNYPNIPLEKFTTTLKGVKASEEKTTQEIVKNRSNTKNIIIELLGFEPTDEELAKVNKATDKEVNQVISEMISLRSNIGWTSGGHTGGDVTLYTYTSNDNNKLTGVVQNTDIAKYVAKAMDGDLDNATKVLFVPSKTLISEGISVKVDNNDKTNPKFILSKGGNEYTFFENRNYFVTNGKTTGFNGIVFYNDSEVYFPREAINLIK